MDNCVDYLVSRGIPLDEARESCDIAYKLMQGHEVPVPDAVQPTQDIYNFVPVSEGTEERYVLGVALVPNHLDNNGTFFPPTTVKKTAYNFMVNYQANKFMHMLNLDKKDVSIVESYVAPTDMTVHGRVIKKGTWLMGLVIHLSLIHI